VSASRPCSLKSWMALRTVWEPHPRFLAIGGVGARRVGLRAVSANGATRRHRRSALQPPESLATACSRDAIHPFRRQRHASTIYLQYFKAAEGA
jgi:hypothetical protein